MTTLLTSGRLRVALLNCTLLFLFACAATADRWPQLKLWALLAAACGVAGVTALLYVTAKNTQCRYGKPTLDEVEAPKTEAHSIARALSLNEASANSQAEHFAKLLMAAHYEALASIQFRAKRDTAEVYLSRPRASQMAAYQFSRRAMSDLHAAGHIVLQQRSRGRLVRSAAVNSELAKWKLTEHSDDTFTVVAGAFEIEHFHGRTNIRVLDTSSVTVEAGSRGTTPSNAPPEIKTTVYQ